MRVRLGVSVVGLDRAFFLLGTVERGRQRPCQHRHVVRGKNLKMLTRNPMERDTAARHVFPIPSQRRIGLVTDKDIRRTRIRAEPVGRRDRVIVIAETGHLRRLAVLRGRRGYNWCLGKIEKQPIAQNLPASPEIIETLARRQPPPMPEMKLAAARKVGDHLQSIKSP